jgi:hypothetical protein
MGTMLFDDVAPEILDPLVEQENLRLAWRMRFFGFSRCSLTLAQHAHLQAACLRVFGLRWREDIVKEEPWHRNRL